MGQPSPRRPQPTIKPSTSTGKASFLTAHKPGTLPSNLEEDVEDDAESDGGYDLRQPMVTEEITEGAQGVKGVSGTAQGSRRELTAEALGDDKQASKEYKKAAMKETEAKEGKGAVVSGALNVPGPRDFGKVD